MGKVSEWVKSRKGKKNKAAKNSSLDAEASWEKTIAKTERPQPFECFRCNTEKKSKLRYLWDTSEGIRVICNSCYGFLCSLKK